MDLAALKARQVKALLSPLVSIIVACCVGFVLWRGSLLILAGWMTAGELTVFLSYLGSFFKPVKDLASMNNSIAQTAVAVERIRQILDADSILPEKPDAREQAIHGEIVFDHVAFAYDESYPELRDVSFTVNAGQMIGVVGPTGGGKSTIMSLIPRFYDPSAGKVLVDGIDVRGLDQNALRALRRRMQMIFQDPFASLNPRLSVGQILAEPIQLHLELPPAELRASVPGLKSATAELP